MKKTAVLLLLIFTALTQFAFSDLGAINGDKPVIAVLDFESETLSSFEIEIVVNTIALKLENTKNFILLEDDRKDLILAERGIKDYGYTGTDYLRDMGKILDADYIIAGSIIKEGQKHVIEVLFLPVDSGMDAVSERKSYNGFDLLLEDLAFVPKLITSALAKHKERGFFDGSFELSGGAFISNDYPSGIAALSYLYQYNENFAIGALVSMNIGGLWLTRPVDVGVKMVIGNKRDWFAASFTFGTTPGMGIYFKNFFVNVGIFPQIEAAHTSVTAGYSLDLDVFK